MKKSSVNSVVSCLMRSCICLCFCLVVVTPIACSVLSKGFAKTLNFPIKRFNQCQRLLSLGNKFLLFMRVKMMQKKVLYCLFALKTSKLHINYHFHRFRMECRFNDATKLPKNFAMLKVLAKHLEERRVSVK